VRIRRRKRGQATDLITLSFFVLSVHRMVAYNSLDLFNARMKDSELLHPLTSAGYKIANCADLMTSLKNL
jgi:hypothetical protein